MKDLTPKQAGKLSEIFNLNPMGTISSGTLLIAINDEYSIELLDLLKRNEIEAEKIGEFVPKNEDLKIKEKDGRINHLYYSETDEITKIF